MLSIKFPNGRRVRAMVMEEPVDGVSGIVECVDCDYRSFLYKVDSDSLAQEIEEFANRHVKEPDSRGARRLIRALKDSGAGITVRKTHP